MRKYLCLILLLAAIRPAHAQQFGGNQPSLQWRQIDTDTVRVIFPAGMEAAGRRVADIVHTIARSHHATIGDRVRKVDIVLQNQTLVSNGYVQTGPFRSEFFLAPPPSSTDVGSLNWADQLALHEYRHVLQNVNFRKGLSKVFYYLGGELSQAAANVIAVPDWFWEGDAVVTETALSTQGRGRLPAFFDGFRALELAGKEYSYMQIRNGSYHRLIPNHYATGYLMTSYGRKQYGPQFWRNVTDDAVRYRGVFYPFSRSLKRRTGMNVAKFFQASLDDYSKAWGTLDTNAGWNRDRATASVEIANSDLSADTLTPAAKVVTHYKYLYAAGDSTMIVSKRTFKHIPGFYERRADGHETLIIKPGMGFDDYFSYRNGWLLWTESRYDPRWSWRDYSVVKIYDRNTGRSKTLRQERRCLSPELSFDGKRVAVITITPEQQYRLKILDAQTGEVLQTLPNPENWYYTYPKFTEDDQHLISAVRNKDGQMALIRQSLSDSAVKMLIPFGAATLGIPLVQGDDVYFTAAYADADNVYQLRNGEIRQITQRPNGVHHMAVSGDHITFSELTVDGYQLLRTPLKEGRIIKGIFHQPWLQPDFGEGGNILDKIPAQTYKDKKYPKTYRLFNFHSWLPEINDPEYGIFVYSDNVLNTLQSSAGYMYNSNEQSHTISANLLYGGLFPYIRLGGDYRMQRFMQINDTISLQWNETDWYAGLSIPLNFTSGKYFRYLTVSGNYHQLDRHHTASSKYRFKDRHIPYYDLSLSFSNQRMKALQHIFSHFGQSLSLQYFKSINNVPAEQFLGRFDLYLPGLSANHSLVLQAAYQQRDTMLRYSFSDNFVYARGYGKPFYEHITKVAANYHFPICYPDWGFANIIYFMRLRGNLFYDHSVAYNFRTKKDGTYASTGVELFVDTKLGNALPFIFGMRYSQRLNEHQGNRFELIVPLQQLFRY